MSNGRYQKNKPRTAVADLALVDDEQERRELESLRTFCIERQHWLDDRSFLVGFDRGEEIAWPSIDAFEQARLDYLRQIQRRRRGKVGAVGERKNRKYGLLAAWSSLRWALLIVVLLIGGYVLIDNRFFLPKGDPSSRIWIASDERAAMEAAANEAAASSLPEPVAMKDIGAPAGDVSELRADAISEHNRLQERYYSRPAMAWSRRLMIIGYGMMLWWIVRRLTRKKEKAPKIPEVIRLDMLPE